MDITTLAECLNNEKIKYSLSSPMSLLTSFKIGGPADILIEPSKKEEIIRSIELCHSKNVPITIIGKGSNLLVSDDGIEGAVIKVAGGLDEIKLVDENTVVCGAGASLSSLCTFAQSYGLSGLEFAYGIPGSVGGAVYMNAGAYGGEMKDVVASVTYLTADGIEQRVSFDEIDFGYRKSFFSGKDYIILSATFSLSLDDKKAINDRMNDFINRRKEKQPLSFPSGGSTFKRPPDNFAGALIEKSGLKGFSIGGAQVSEKHAGFVINKGDATCEDVLALMAHIVKTVKEQHGVTLEPEIIKIGR